MGNAQSGKAIREGALGLYAVKSLTVVTNVLNPIFTVTGGLIQVEALVGEVTTAIPNTASLTIKLQATPSGGAAADLCAATGITNDAVGSLYSLSSAVATDLLSVQSVSAIGGTPVAASEVPSVTYAPGLFKPVILRAGSIGVLCSNHTVTPGVIKWHIAYVPIEPNARVAAA